jgi:hypothetical protein
MARLSSLTISYIVRNIRKRAPLSSALFNDVFTELGQDLSLLASEWNTYLIPLLDTIPDGTDDTTVDAFTNGLSGTSLYADSDATTMVNSDYYNVTADRPNTIEEQFDELYTYVDEQVAASEQYNTVAKTSAYSITDAESDTIYYNSGLSQPTLTLPDGSGGEGLSYLFYITSAVGLRVAVTGSDTIALGASTSAVAGYIESTTIGSTCRIVNIAANQWVAIYYTGTWTVT